MAEYIRRFRQHGVAGLRFKARGGARAKRTKVDAATSVELLAGLRQGRWKRAKEIRHWLAEKRGTRLASRASTPGCAAAAPNRRCRTRATANKIPPRPPRSKTQLAAELGALGLPPTAKVRLWVADEHRYGLIGVIRKVWRLRRVKPTAPGTPNTS